MRDYIFLDPEKKITRGSTRLIFEHPDDSSLLIKVSRFNPKYYYSKNFEDIKVELKRRYEHHCMLREINEYLRICLREHQGEIHQYLSKFTGFIDTNLGIGFIVEAQKTQEGKLAPTLKNLLKSKQFTHEHHQSLEDFFRIYCESNIIIGDLNQNNIVFIEKNDKITPIIVDGLGDKTLVPIRSWSSTANDKMKIKSVNKLKKIIRDSFH